MTNVAAITRFTSTPISRATCGFCAVARIAVPSRVRYTSSASPAIMAKHRPRMASCTPVMVAPNTVKVVSGMICGNAITFRLQTSIARCCRMIETPIAVISGARRGALRSGR